MAVGDTILFQRRLDNYPPADGWALNYILTDLQTNQAVPTLVSTAVGQNHQISQNNFAAVLDPGDYIFSGYAVLGAERHEIYRAVLTLTPDFADNTALGPLKTEAQEMIEILRTSLKQLYVQQFQETDVQKNKFVMQKQGEVLKSLQYWKEMRLNEIQLERARNGKPSGAVSAPVFCIG